jgi:hypothetical protein
MATAQVLNLPKQPAILVVSADFPRFVNIMEVPRRQPLHTPYHQCHAALGLIAITMQWCAPSSHVSGRPPLPPLPPSLQLERGHGECVLDSDQFMWFPDSQGHPELCTRDKVKWPDFQETPPYCKCRAKPELAPRPKLPKQPYEHYFNVSRG